MKTNFLVLKTRVKSRWVAKQPKAMVDLRMDLLGLMKPNSLKALGILLISA